MLDALPFISIIVPNYNHYNYLVKRLESIFNQTFQDFEVILLDDCSTDDSREILLEYAKNPKVSHCVFNEINSGNTFVQWNKGIALAKGEYIWIAESDDFCELNFLEELIKPLIEDKDVVLAYCQSTRVNKKSEITGSWLNHTNDLDTEIFKTNFSMEGNDFVENFLIYKNVIPNASGVVFNRSRTLEIGGVDTDVSLKFVSDWMFYLHLILNKKVFFSCCSLNHFRYHSESVIATSVKSRKAIETCTILLKTRAKINRILNDVFTVNNEKLLKINNLESQQLVSKRAILFFKEYKIGRILLKLKDKVASLFVAN